MLPDHELSALVAEKVAGWTRNGPADRWRDPNGGSFFHESFWPPSFATDQGLALEAALKPGKTVTIQPDWLDKGLAWVGIGEDFEYPDVATEYAALGTTVARALCLAALRASGVEVEDDGEEPKPYEAEKGGGK